MSPAGKRPSRRKARPARKKTARRRAPKRVAKKVARKRAPRRRAARKRVARRKAAPKRATKKAARRKVAKKRATRRKAAPKKAAPKKRATRQKVAAKRIAVGRTAPRRAPRPRLAVVGAKKRRRPKGETAATLATPAFPQRAGASPKQLILFELVRTRAALHAAFQGLGPAQANQPVGEGKWSVREMVLHLVTRDQARLREMEYALRGVQASWKGVDDARMDAINADLLAPIRHLEWEEALRLLHRTRQELMEAIESVPEEFTEVWSPEHPFGWMLHALPPHDRHHADIIKRWRAERGA